MCQEAFLFGFNAAIPGRSIFLILLRKMYLTLRPRRHGPGFTPGIHDGHHAPNNGWKLEESVLCQFIVLQRRVRPGKVDRFGDHLFDAAR